VSGVVTDFDIEEVPAPTFGSKTGSKMTWRTRRGARRQAGAVWRQV